MRERVCAACGGNRLEPGFVEDTGESAQGYARWIPGAMERGIFGGAKRFGKNRHAIEAFRCRECAYLNLYVTNEA